MSFRHFLLLSEPVTILQAPYFLLPNVAEGENRGHIVMGNTMLASTAGNIAHRSRTATISPWTSRTRPTFFQASCCRSLAGRHNGYRNRISATGDGTRSGSAGSCLPPEGEVPDGCQRRTSRATAMTATASPIPGMSNRRNFGNGVGRSPRRLSICSRQRRQ